MLRNEQLYKQMFDLKTLEENLDSLSLRSILHTQTLDVSFCVNYILNPQYAFSQEDTYLDYTNVLKHQPHLKPQELIEALKLKTTDGN